MTSNPFFAPSALPYRLPPFADIRAEHYPPAFDAGMAERLVEIRAIAACVEPPSFENTIVALERSGAILMRVLSAFLVQSSADPDDAINAIEAEVNPKLAAHRDAISLDRDLFARIETLHRNRADLGLDAESLHLLERYHTDFVRAGARLSPADQDRLRALNEELAGLSTTFQQNVSADTRAATVVVDTADELAGLTPAAIGAAAAHASELGHAGKYALRLKNFSGQTELAALDDRKLRERLFQASVGRGWADNGDVAVRIARLRAEHAALLGYPNHAAYQVENQTARTVEAVEAMLGRLVGPAIANARREAVLLSAAADHELEAWDWAYYSERVRKAEYDFDSTLLRDYFELDRVLVDGAFFAAGQVYGLSFTERPDLVGHHPDVRVFEVHDADGSALGLFLGDFFARPAKRGGPWMVPLVTQSRLLGAKPVAVTSFNIAKPSAGQPALMTFDEVRALFHEFGHALHGLMSDVRYALVAGTAVARDFVEYPSQVNEMWMVWPEVLANYAKHYETGEPVPAELLARMRAAAQFGQGFKTVEQLGATLLDWAWHTLPGSSGAGSHVGSGIGSIGAGVAAEAEVGAKAEAEFPQDAEAFEAAVLERADIAFPLIPPRYRTTYFLHIFSHGYSAAYYSYLWSEVLDADTVDWFKENGGMTRENGDAFRYRLLAKGGSVDSMTAYVDFRGRLPRIEPLLRRRGLLG
jgi:peptidyl-dipeptidase Dcp